MEGYKWDWGWIWISVGRLWLASFAVGKKGGRERCTLRRFKIRGLIEGMLRRVIGNICSGHKHRWAAVPRGQQVTRATSWPAGQRKETVSTRCRGEKEKKQRNKCKRVNNRETARQGEIKERDQDGKKRKSEKKAWELANRTQQSGLQWRDKYFK